MNNRARGGVFESRAYCGRSASYIKHTSRIVCLSSGVAQCVACRAHYPEVRGPIYYTYSRFAQNLSRAERMVCAVQRFRFDTLRELSATHIAYKRSTVFYSRGVVQRLGIGAMIQRPEKVQSHCLRSTGSLRGQVFCFSKRALECGVLRASAWSRLQAAKLHGGSVLEP